MVARPLEFLSSVKLRPPPLEVRRKLQDSFSDESGKWNLLSHEEGKRGLYLICGVTSVFLSS